MTDNEILEKNQQCLAAQIVTKFLDISFGITKISEMLRPEHRSVRIGDVCSPKDGEELSGRDMVLYEN